ncbi:MAG: hypothetical protein ACTSSB_13025 [Candidatus Heimdallarchaeota archaeon]
MSGLEIRNEENPELKTQKVLLGLYWSIAPIMFLTIGLAWGFYPEKFEFFYEFISQLGGLVSENNHENIISSRIMTVGFGLIGLIFLVTAIIYIFKPKLEYNKAKSALNFVMVIGSAGIFLVGFGFLNFVDQYLRFNRKHRKQESEKNRDYYRDYTMMIIVFVFLIIFVLSYVLRASVDHWLAQYPARISQKLILIVDCIAIFFLDVNDM